MFGEVAALYDRVRPAYPVACVDDLLRFAGLPAPGARALDAGAGTGKATAALAARGVPVVALEPSRAMAAVARRRLAAWPGVTVRQAAFEAARLPAGGFRLVLAAQAWHWFEPATRWPRAAGLLEPGGALALLWNVPDWRAQPLRPALDAAYRRWAPRLDARTPGGGGNHAVHDRPHQDPARRGWFGPMTRGTYRWHEIYPTAVYLDLLRTQSHHRLLAPADRERLLAAVAAVIDGDGVRLEVAYTTECYLARREPGAGAVRAVG
ncbi:MAG TPA: methyltransferase domain-containing protein [Candidatus Dormibacteraeota bacterium]|nr:methyltransferase domain-containing protein [Candidatus Dormibacteraeota bacterium]